MKSYFVACIEQAMSPGRYPEEGWTFTRKAPQHLRERFLEAEEIANADGRADDFWNGYVAWVVDKGEEALERACDTKLTQLAQPAQPPKEAVVTPWKAPPIGKKPSKNASDV